MSYAYDSFVFHYVVHRGLTVLCMTEQQTPSVQAFRFLAAVEHDFTRLFSAARWQTARAYAFDADFKHELARLMALNAQPLQDEKVLAINEQLGEIKNIMAKNIELVLARGEKIEILVTKTSVLEEHAIKFSKTATKVKRRMWWANAKWGVVLVIVLLALVYIILALSCGGPDIPKCR